MSAASGSPHGGAGGGGESGPAHGLVPARLEVGERVFEVRAWIGARVEPVDGRMHRDGRIAPDPGVAALVRAGHRDAVLDGIPVRLTEVDPWGGVLVRGRTDD